MCESLNLESFNQSTCDWLHLGCGRYGRGFRSSRLQLPADWLARGGLCVSLPQRRLHDLGCRTVPVSSRTDVHQTPDGEGQQTSGRTAAKNLTETPRTGRLGLFQRFSGHTLGFCLHYVVSCDSEGQKQIRNLPRRRSDDRDGLSSAQ